MQKSLNIGIFVFVENSDICSQFHQSSNIMKSFRHITSILMILLIVALASGTVVEKLHGNDFALTHVYSTWWFIALWTCFGIIGAILTFSNRNWKRPVALTLFLSVACILIGALLTMLTGQHGEMTLKPEVATSQFTIERHGNTKECTLPFSLTLDRFEVETYPGTRSPMDFVSYLKVCRGHTRPLYITYIWPILSALSLGRVRGALFAKAENIGPKENSINKIAAFAEAFLSNKRNSPFLSAKARMMAMRSRM